jgi:hypothetical protein
MACNLLLKVALQQELNNVAAKDTATKNKAQLWSHINEVNIRLRAIVQLPMTSRLSKLQKTQQSVKNIEAQILALLEEKERFTDESTSCRKIVRKMGRRIQKTQYHDQHHICPRDGTSKNSSKLLQSHSYKPFSS